MSFFGNIGHAISGAVSGVGHAVGSVASNPITKLLLGAGLAATGVGAPMAAGILGTVGAAGGALKPGGGLRDAVTGGVTGAAAGGLAGKLGSMVRGAGGIGSMLGGIGANPGQGGPADASNPGDGSGGGTGILDRIKNIAGGVGSSLLGAGGSGSGGAGGSGGTSVLDKLLMAGTVGAGAYDATQKKNLQNKAQDYATNAYDAKAPIRARAIAALSSPTPVDPRIAAVSADPGNVYDRARRARMLAASVTPAPSTPTVA